MKKTQMIPLALYLALVLYFAIFNWDVFIVTLQINLGFSLFNAPLIAMIFIVGWVFLLIQWGLAYFRELKYHRELAKKADEIASLRKEFDLNAVKADNEINALKASLFEEQEEQIKRNSDHITELGGRLDKLEELLPDFTQGTIVSKLSGTDDISGGE